MAERRYLVDTSVLGRAHKPRVGDRLEELAGGGLMWTCRLIDLEVLYGVRAWDVGRSSLSGLGCSRRRSIRR